MQPYSPKILLTACSNHTENSRNPKVVGSEGFVLSVDGDGLNLLGCRRVGAGHGLRPTLDDINPASPVIRNIP